MFGEESKAKAGGPSLVREIDMYHKELYTLTAVMWGNSTSGCQTIKQVTQAVRLGEGRGSNEVASGYASQWNLHYEPGEEINGLAGTSHTLLQERDLATISPGPGTC